MGILNELGMWTMKLRIGYHKLMLLHHLIRSDEERVLRKIVEEQIRKNKDYGFYHECKKVCKEIAIEIKEIKEIKKSTWKKTVKEGINKRMEQERKRKEA